MNAYAYTDGYQPVLISKFALLNYFDRHDLTTRQNSHNTMKNAYHENWLHREYFLLPSFWIEDGRTFIGNGRHRLTLLSHHLEEIPAAFEGLKDDSAASSDLLEKIVIRKLGVAEVLTLPDLPIENLGQDVNESGNIPMWKRFFE